MVEIYRNNNGVYTYVTTFDIHSGDFDCWLDDNPNWQSKFVILLFWSQS